MIQSIPFFKNEESSFAFLIKSQTVHVKSIRSHNPGNEFESMQNPPHCIWNVCYCDAFKGWILAG